MENERSIFGIFYYQKDKNGVQARKKLSDLYGENVLTEGLYQNWFAKSVILIVKTQ